jgi:colanic acid biosynthesis glycosyl transferase WcaI
VSNVVVWTPNYAPEPTGIPPLVTDAAEWLAARGHCVEAVTALPNYPERRIHSAYRGALWRTEERNGVRVRRSWLRAKPERTMADKALYELTISTFALPNALRVARRADVIVCVVPTLLAAAYAVLIAKAFRKRLVFWVQDLVLSAGLSVAGPRGRRILHGARGIEAAIFRAADRIVVCSPGFRDYLVSAGIAPERVEVILNWADTVEIRAEPLMSNGSTRFLYSGNLGHTQGFETLVEAAKLSGEGIDVDIVGSGNAADDVRRLAALVPNVSVRSPVAQEAYPALLASADAHLVIQRKISAGANLPSKIATALASGRPIVASIDPDTPAASLLRDSGGAILVEPESPGALAQAMRQLADDPERRASLGRSGRAYAEEHLSKESALRRLETAILP